jgi:WXXGXW repeat (2 copies)
MKKLLVIMAIATSLFATTGCAGGYVDAQPADEYYDQGVAPGPGYVWIDGDWVWGGGRYTYHHGYWGHARAGRTWQKGNWAHTSRGYHWNSGHWR